MTDEQRERKRERERERRRLMTDEQRERDRERKRVASMTDEQRERDRERKRVRVASMTDEQRERKRERWRLMTDEQRERKRERERERWRLMTDEQRARARERKHKQRGILITSEQWSDLFVSQGRRCAICRSDSPRSRHWHTDHCHETGRVRGILCASCNRGLGAFRDEVVTMEHAIDYLRTHRACGHLACETVSAGRCLLDCVP